MGPLGILQLLFIFVPFLLIPVVVGLVALFELHRRARQLGYPSARAYLRAIPRSDAERRDAVGLALLGLVLCLLGMILAPVVLIGLPPLFYGVRKVAYALMGLGLVDDAN